MTFTNQPIFPICGQRYALRESPKGALEGDYGVPSGTANPVVEPFLNRKGESDLTPGFDAAALLTAGAWMSRHHTQQPAYDIRFEDRWIAHPGQLTAWEPTAAEPSHTVCQITRGVSLTGDALNAWLHTPPERAATYLLWFAQVSADVQIALRRWLPYLLLRHDAILENPGLRGSLLFYAATRPYFARVRGRFTWDVICPDSMATVFRSGSQNLSAVMEQAQRYALAAGRPDLADAFSPSEMRTILIHVRRDPRALKALLNLEDKLIESLLALAEKGHAIAASQIPPKNLHRFCADWAHTLQTRLRRVLGPVSAPDLVYLALVEGTTSLARCQGLTPDRHDWITFRTANQASAHLALPDTLPLAA